MVSSLSCALRNPFLQSLLHFSQPYSKPFPLSVLQAICAPLSKNTEKGHSKNLNRESPLGVDQLNSPVCRHQSSLFV